MFGFRLLLLLSAGLLSGHDCQTLLHTTYPQKITPNITEDDLGEDESVQTYIITIQKKTYTVHLKQQVFLPDDFMIYTYNKRGFVHPNSPRILNDCFYQGYVQGFPNSVATLSTCSGLRGLLQFENITYGIEYLDSSSGFEHLVYLLNNKNILSPLLAEDYISAKGEVTREVSHKLLSDSVPLQDILKTQRYLEMYIVLDKELYNYMGGKKDAVTQRTARLIAFVNSIFSSLNITIVLSSLEFWTDYNKISTLGEPDELLRRFLQWKNSFLVLRPHDVAYLFVYRETPHYVGAAFSGKLCVRNFDAGVALYQKGVLMETFSVILAQLLGLSLGMEYDDRKDCWCPGSICVMNTSAVYSNGIKAFSSCSIKDFQNFIKYNGGHCLSNRPHLKLHYTRQSSKSLPVCGNNIVEAGEKCDCGTAEQCKQSKCCTETCTFRRGALCSNELCCQNCKFKARNKICRPAIDNICDFPEYCNGSSSACPHDVYVQNGYVCGDDTGYCYEGSCQSPDLHCQKIFGKTSRNAPHACYEEINGQTDRFGHCGSDSRTGYKTCLFRNIRCGKLICLYPSDVPFLQINVPVLYIPVRDTMCVSLDFKQPEKELDPMLVKEGTKCGIAMVCMKQACEKYEVLKYDCNPEKKCSGRGICNNNRNCHCNPGWAPPDCQKKGHPLGGSVDSGIRVLESDIAERAMEYTVRTWLLLSFFLFLPIVIGSAILVAKKTRLQDYFAEEDEEQDNNESDETNTLDKASMVS